MYEMVYTIRKRGYIYMHVKIHADVREGIYMYTGPGGSPALHAPGVTPSPCLRVLDAGTHPSPPSLAPTTPSVGRVVSCHVVSCRVYKSEVAYGI